MGGHQSVNQPGNDTIDAAFHAGRSAWADVGLDFPLFARMVGKLDAPDRLALWPADFYLACAAGARNPVAIAAVDRTCVVTATSRIRGLGATVDETEEALQATRERLFVGKDPRILAYNASAPLKQWVQVIAVRIAIDQRRSRRADQTALFVDEGRNDVADPSPDASTVLLKTTYRRAFEEVLKLQIARLSPRDRVVLRLHLIEGISVEKISQMRAVHRVTVARWIWNAGDTILEGLRAHFLERFGILPGEFDSLANLVRSQLTLDWSSLLA